MCANGCVCAEECVSALATNNRSLPDGIKCAIRINVTNCNQYNDDIVVVIRKYKYIKKVLCVFLCIRKYKYIKKGIQ